VLSLRASFVVIAVLAVALAHTSRSFIARYPVTIAQYDAYLVDIGRPPSGAPRGMAHHGQSPSRSGEDHDGRHILRAIHARRGSWHDRQRRPVRAYPRHVWTCRWIRRSPGRTPSELPPPRSTKQKVRATEATAKAMQLPDSGRQGPHPSCCPSR